MKLMHSHSKPQLFTLKEKWKGKNWVLCLSKLQEGGDKICCLHYNIEYENGNRGIDRSLAWQQSQLDTQTDILEHAVQDRKFMLKKGWPALFSKRHYMDLLPGPCRHKGYIKRANSPVGKTVVNRTLMIRVKADLMRPVMVTLQNKEESNGTIYVQVFLITNIKNDTLVIKHHWNILWCHNWHQKFQHLQQSLLKTTQHHSPEFYL